MPIHRKGRRWRSATPHCIKLLKEFIASIEEHPKLRAIDVAGGDGRLSETLLTGLYDRVDIFDQSPDGVELAKKTLQKHKSFGYADEASMQTFKWKFKYNGIFMVWCSGYLNDPTLAAFLRRAKTQLITPAVKTRRRYKPTSFIFIFDNVLDNG